MTRNYTIRTRINKPVAEVFNAVIAADVMAGYFTNSASGDLIAGSEVLWTWDEYGSNTVFVKTILPDRLIELTLDAGNWSETSNESYEILVAMEFEAPADNITRVSISESGWRMDPAGYKGSHDNCGGWQDMLLCLKAYLEYGIDLRR